MIAPNRHVAKLARYQLPDISGPPGKRTIQLAQNESAWPMSPKAMEAACEALARAQLYPDTEWRELRQSIAEVNHLDPELILCAAGSMELIDCIARVFLEPGDEAVSSQYGYLFFRTACATQGASVCLAPERDYRCDIEAMADAVTPKTKLVFVTNPGNPTGTVISHDELAALRAKLREDLLLVIDEAYGEFAEGQGPRAFDLVKEHRNTIVLRTFSKAYGMAGLRAGWAYTPAEIRAELRKILSPSSLNSASQAAAAAAMRDQHYRQQICDRTKAIRDSLTTRLRALGLSVPESHTNFVLVIFESEEEAASARQALYDEGVVVRPMGGYGLPQAFRITIGTAEDTEIAASLLEAWRKRENA